MKKNRRMSDPAALDKKSAVSFLWLHEEYLELYAAQLVNRGKSPIPLNSLMSMRSTLDQVIGGSDLYLTMSLPLFFTPIEAETKVDEVTEFFDVLGCYQLISNVFGRSLMLEVSWPDDEEFSVSLEAVAEWIKKQESRRRSVSTELADTLLEVAGPMRIGKKSDLPHSSFTLLSFRPETSGRQWRWFSGWGGRRSDLLQLVDGKDLYSQEEPSTGLYPGIPRSMTPGNLYPSIPDNHPSTWPYALGDAPRMTRDRQLETFLTCFQL